MRSSKKKPDSGAPSKLCMGGVALQMATKLSSLLGWQRRWRTKTGLVLTCLALAPVAGLPAPPDKPAGIDAIRAYEGTWEITIDHFDTAHSKAGHEKSTLRNDCWKSGGYYACNQYVNGESKVLLVFTYSESKKQYTTYPIPTDGSEAGSGTLLIEGNVWTYPWKVTEGNTTTWFRVVNVFESPDRIQFRQEFSADQQHWTLMAKGGDIRVGPK